MRLLIAVMAVLVCSGLGPLPADPQHESLERIDELNRTAQYADAERAAREALGRVERDADAHTVAAALLINRLVESRLHQGKADAEAQQLADRAAGIFEQSAPRSRDYAAALRNQAWILELRGDARRAADVYTRALEVLRDIVGREDPATLVMQKDVAMAYRSAGDFPRARGLLEEALDALTRTHPGHPDIAVLRFNLGAVQWEQGEYAAARDSFIEAAEGLTRVHGPQHPRVSHALEGLAVVQVALGEYAQARATYLRSLAIREKTLPPDHPDLGYSLVNLGDVLLAMGDTAAAIRALERGLAIWEKALGPEHPMLVVALTNVAAAKERLGDRTGARRAFERGIAIREKAHGPDDADLVIPLTQLANLVADAGELASARPLYARARRIAEKTRGADHPYVAATDVQEGRRLAAAGLLADAAPLIDRAVAARLRLYGPDHPDVAEALDAQARLAAAREAAPRAIDLALEAEAVARAHFQMTAAVLPERQALIYAEGRAGSQDLALREAIRTRATSGDVARRLWDAVVRSRALVLDEMASRQRVAASAQDPELKALLDAVASARGRLAQLFVRGPSADRPADFAAALTAARRESERAEERLAARSAPYRLGRERRVLDFAAVRAALPAGAALVGYIRYTNVVFHQPGARAPESYAVFVLTSSAADPVLLPLGAAEAIDALVSRWRRMVRDEAAAPPMGARTREQRYRAVGAQLRRQIWDPVARHLEGAARVLIVPDAALHLVDFAALPAGTREYLIETGPAVHYASAERDLAAARVESGTGLLAIGAPAFDRAPATAQNAAAVLRSDCEVGPRANFEALPESGVEAEAVARHWRRASQPVTLLRGAQASETNVKTHAPGHRVLHFATHAFVMGEGCPVPADSRGARAGTDALAANPLLGAGVVLAGATRPRRAPGADDGILTAEEISALDLSGVEWAVLSACDSGLGLTRAGEGVFGLRRAFQVAGARTVITSLWPVEDRAARVWMESLYAARAGRGQSTVDAMRQAGLAAIRERRRSALSAHPFYWSGFVAAGDWR